MTLNGKELCIDLESIIQVVPDSEGEIARHQICNLSWNFANGKIPNYKIVKVLSKLKNDKDIFFMKTDKSEKIALIDQGQYIIKKENTSNNCPVLYLIKT